VNGGIVIGFGDAEKQKRVVAYAEQPPSSEG
jgi:hypothetical protein